MAQSPPTLQRYNSEPSGLPEAGRGTGDNGDRTVPFADPLAYAGTDPFAPTSSTTNTMPQAVTQIPIPNLPIPKGAVFDGKSDVTEFIEYARIMTAHTPQIHKNYALGHYIYALLSQKVRTQLKLRLGDTEDGEAVARRLLEVYGETKSRNQYRKSLRSAKQGATESLRDFLNRLESLAHHAYDAATERPYAVAEAFENGMRDTRIREQYTLLRNAPDEDGPPDLRQILRLAERLEQSFQDTQHTAPQVTSVTVEQGDRKCTTDLTNMRNEINELRATLNAVSHGNKELQERGASYHRGRGRGGGYAPTPRLQTPRLTVCFRCGGHGHISRWCSASPQVQPNLSANAPEYIPQQQTNQTAFQPAQTMAYQRPAAALLPTPRCDICGLPSCMGPRYHCPWCKSRLAKDPSQSILHVLDCPNAPINTKN